MHSWHSVGYTPRSCRLFCVKAHIGCTFTATNPVNRLMFTSIMRMPPRSFGWIRSCWRLTLVFRHASWAVSKRLSIEIESDCFEHGMNTSEYRAGERIVTVRLTEVTLVVDLADGRSISVPLAWYPRLLHATPAQRNHWQLAGAGFG